MTQVCKLCNTHTLHVCTIVAICVRRQPRLKGRSELHQLLSLQQQTATRSSFQPALVSLRCNICLLLVVVFVACVQVSGSCKLEDHQGRVLCGSSARDGGSRQR
jgi:hypothetical protein